MVDCQVDRTSASPPRSGRHLRLDILHFPRLWPAAPDRGTTSTEGSQAELPREGVARSAWEPAPAAARATGTPAAAQTAPTHSPAAPPWRLITAPATAAPSARPALFAVTSQANVRVAAPAGVSSSASR